MIFEQLNSGPCLTYLIVDEETKKAVLVDPVLEHVQFYVRMLTDRRLSLDYVIDTHSHADHLSGAPWLRDVTECDYVAHRLAPAGCVTMRVDEGSTLHAGDLEIDVIATPGHTQDSISLRIDDKLLTGDALFLDDGGAGRDDLPGGDPAAHWESLQRLLALDENLIVYPAHDYRQREPSSLKRQKSTNPHLKPRSKRQFVDYLEDLKLGPADWMKDVLKANYACAMDPRAAWIPADAPAYEVKGTIGGSANEIQVASISVEELYRRLDLGNRPLILDVRDIEELDGELGHLSSIVHIPVTVLSRRLQELDQFRDREVVTVCRSGGRAITAA